MRHEHGDASAWRFEDPPETLVVTTRAISHGTMQVAGIAHDGEADWQVLDGTDVTPEDGVLVCFGCLLRAHPELEQFHDLPIGWQAWSGEDGWVRCEIEECEDNDT